MSHNILKGFINNVISSFKINKMEKQEMKKLNQLSGSVESVVEKTIKETVIDNMADLSIKDDNIISKNFKMTEFAVSSSASAKGHTIVIPEELKPNIVALVENLLQPICDATEWKDLISSGYRDEYTNNLVGGVSNSQHRKGEAADNNFYYKDENNKTVFLKPIEVLRKVVELNLDFDQMIAYNNFVHLSFTTSRDNRKEILYNKSYTGERL